MCTPTEGLLTDHCTEQVLRSAHRCAARFSATGGARATGRVRLRAGELAAPSLGPFISRMLNQDGSEARIER